MQRKLFLFIPFVCIFCQTVFCQTKKFTNLIEQYFRTTPYNKEFSNLVNFYITDPDFVIDSNSKRSDTSIFYLRGYHKTFNPFSFPVNYLVFTIRERNDSLSLISKNKESNFQISVSGLIDSNEKSIQLLKNELAVITEKFKRFLNEPGYMDSKDKNAPPFEFYFYNKLTTGWTYLPYYRKGLYITLILPFVVKIDKISL